MLVFGVIKLEKVLFLILGIVLFYYIKIYILFYSVILIEIKNYIIYNLIYKINILGEF